MRGGVGGLNRLVEKACGDKVDYMNSSCMWYAFFYRYLRPQALSSPPKKNHVNKAVFSEINCNQVLRLTGGLSL